MLAEVNAVPALVMVKSLLIPIAPTRLLKFPENPELFCCRTLTPGVKAPVSAVDRLLAIPTRIDLEVVSNGFKSRLAIWLLPISRSGL